MCEFTTVADEDGQGLNGRLLHDTRSMASASEAGDLLSARGEREVGGIRRFY